MHRVPCSFLQCDVCGRWCHGECVGMDKQQAEETEEYTCTLCAAAAVRKAAAKAAAAAAKAASHKVNHRLQYVYICDISVYIYTCVCVCICMYGWMYNMFLDV